MDRELLEKIEEGLSRDRHWAQEALVLWPWALKDGLGNANAHMNQVLFAWNAWSDRPPPPAPDLPPDPDGTRRGCGLVRQVGVKLTEDDFQRLRRAGRAYGLSRSEMARVLVKRGVDMALERETDRVGGDESADAEAGGS